MARGWWDPVHSEERDKARAEKNRQLAEERKRKQAERDRKKAEMEAERLKARQTQEAERTESHRTEPRTIGEAAPRRVPVPEAFQARVHEHALSSPPPERTTGVRVPTGTDPLQGTPERHEAVPKKQDISAHLRGLFPPGVERDIVRDWVKQGKHIRFYRGNNQWYMQVEKKHISVDDFSKIVTKNKENYEKSVRDIKRLGSNLEGE